MATKTVEISSSGGAWPSATTSTATLVSGTTNTKYKVTAFSLDWNNNGAYIESNGTNQFTLQLKIGTTVVTIGTYSRSNATGSTAYGARPTISWSGTALGTSGGAIQLVGTQVNGNRARILNLFKVTVTYTTVSKPSVTAGDVITKSQMDDLKTFLNKGTSVTQNGIITETVGDTYAACTSGNPINASWYNNA